LRDRRCSLRAAGAAVVVVVVVAALAHHLLQVQPLVGVRRRLVRAVLLRAPAVVAEARRHHRFRPV
jgi:hypothetical protein